MATTADAVRQVKIKTGSVRRLTKELDAYAVEAVAEEAKVASMRAAGAEAHDLKHAVRFFFGRSGRGGEAGRRASVRGAMGGRSSQTPTTPTIPRKTCWLKPRSWCRTPGPG
jgi:hypothetical protein